MRGKLGEQTLPPRLVRIIPAHAGQTSWAASVRYAFADHPRACGANLPEAYLVRDVLGSSPRMRGKRHGDRAQPRTLRIIPAHAGQTRTPSSRSRPPPDHPRACGANLPPMPAIPIAAGSSPRMRGKLTLRRRHDHCERIIPAHAGQTDLDKFYGDVNADHPRACGANDRTPLETLTIFGSSPRMRGKQRFSCSTRRDGRIIPAHAGQTHADRR